MSKHIFSPLYRAFKYLFASEAIYGIDDMRYFRFSWVFCRRHFKIRDWLGYCMSEVGEFWESYRASQGGKLNIKPFRLKLVSKKGYKTNTMSAIGYNFLVVNDVLDVFNGL